jgi:endonuclease YncB( thermonuclease family)
MIQLYILAGISALILGLFAWGKINASRAATAQAKVQSAEDTAASAVAAVDQVVNTQTVRVKAKQAAQVKQKVEQVAIDAGDRSQFDKDTF